MKLLDNKTMKTWGMLAASYGLSVRYLNGGNHVQIVGGPVLVNYYPTRSSIYVNGTTQKQRRTGGFDLALSIARKGSVEHVPIEERLRRPLRWLRKNKKRLLTKDPHCMWCKCALTEATATIEHIIPLARGGSHQEDNLGISCEPCNVRRGDKPPPGDANWKHFKNKEVAK